MAAKTWGRGLAGLTWSLTCGCVAPGHAWSLTGLELMKKGEYECLFFFLAGFTVARGGEEDAGAGAAESRGCYMTRADWNPWPEEEE